MARNPKHQGNNNRGNAPNQEQDNEREVRVALALLVRRHMIECGPQILAAFMEKEITHKTQTHDRGVKTSTALAKLMGLPAYHNVTKGKPEPAKHLLDFLQGAGPAHCDPIYNYFKDHVITPEYRAVAPAYIQMAIHQVFDTNAIGNSRDPNASKATKDPQIVLLREAAQQARYAPHAVISAIEETHLQFLERAKAFVGRWNVLRYAHHGKRVVRLAMEVTSHEAGRLTFKIYFRTHGMTVSKSRDVYITRGSLIVLKGGQHVMLWGHEETQDGGILPDGYPVSIICPTRITRDGPFMGLVQRRHDDGKIFAIKAQFVRESKRSIEELLADKVGSYQRPEDIARMSEDIEGFEALMSELRRSPDDTSGGLTL